MDFALGVFDDFPDRFCRYTERSGESADKCAAAEVALAEFFEPPQSFGLVPKSAAMDQLDTTQAKFSATIGNKCLYRKRFVVHRKSSVRLS